MERFPKIKRNKDGSIDFSITVNSLIEVKGRILNWGEHAEVLGPTELVLDMKKELKKCSKNISNHHVQLFDKTHPSLIGSTWI